MIEALNFFTPEQWSVVIDAALYTAAMLVPGFAAYAKIAMSAKNKLLKTNDQLVGVFNEIKQSNPSLHKKALELDYTEAAKALEVNLN